MLIWSLLKFLVLVGVAAGLTFGAIWLMDLQAGAQLVVAGLEFNLSPPVLAVGLAILLVVLWLFLKLLGLLSALLRFLTGDKMALSRYLSPNGESKQSRALTDVTMALAAGDGEAALTKLRKAERYLKQHDLNALLTAQAADMAGNRKKAEEIYKRLLSDHQMRVIGLRGLFRQTLTDGDTDAALKLGISEHTIRSHVKQIFDKMQITSRAELSHRVLSGPMGWLTRPGLPEPEATLPTPPTTRGLPGGR